jgi:hypothetical protein
MAIALYASKRGGAKELKSGPFYILAVRDGVWGMEPIGTGFITGGGHSSHFVRRGFPAQQGFTRNAGLSALLQQGVERIEST